MGSQGLSHRITIKIATNTDILAFVLAILYPSENHLSTINTSMQPKIIAAKQRYVVDSLLL